MSNDTSDNFDSLADYLHAFPHLNLSLSDIDNKNFNVSNDQYIQSLEVYCLSGAALGIVLFLTFAFLQCCIGCGKCENYAVSYRMKQYNPFLTAFLFFSTLAVMICAVGALYFGVGRVQQEVNRMLIAVEDISQTLDEYNDLISDIKLHVESLKNSTFILPKGDIIAVKLTEIEQELESDRVPDFQDDIIMMIKYNRARELITLAILLVQLFCCSTLLIGICYGRFFVLHCSLIMLTIWMFCLATSLGVNLAGAVASADMCVEHRALVDVIVNMQEIATDVTRIFINCNNKGSENKLVALQNLDNFIKLIHHYLGPSEKILPGVSNALRVLSEDTQKLEEFTACQQLTQMFNRFVQDYDSVIGVLCKPFLHSLCMYCLWACLGIFFGWLVINQLKPFADRVEAWMKVESILDKNITITPDVDETEHLISENSLSSYRKSYGADIRCVVDESDSFTEHLSVINHEHTLYQSLLSNPNQFLSRKISTI